MSNAETDIDQSDEVEVLTDAVTHEALEATCGMRLTGLSTLAYGSYCFTCVERSTTDFARRYRYRALPLEDWPELVHRSKGRANQGR